jgi:GTP-binding protein
MSPSRASKHRKKMEDEQLWADEPEPEPLSEEVVAMLDFDDEPDVDVDDGPDEDAGDDAGSPAEASDDVAPVDVPVVVDVDGEALDLSGFEAVAPPVVAVVGRPNVGKSTLVNRIVGKRVAIVEEVPGVTRDRKELDADWNGRAFTLMDTGGWMPGGSALDKQVSAQAERAILDADAVLFVVDATIGITEEDDRVARLLRRIEAPVFVVANKVDGSNQEAGVWNLLSLGLGDPHPVSALHGRGTGDLLDVLLEALPNAPLLDADDDVAAGGPARSDGLVAVALVGRPNVGKSTLFNRLIGDERSVVHDMPGTTRDAVDTIVDTDEGPIRFIDTAGMRRRTKVDFGPESYSVVRALRAVDGADVSLLVIDSTEGVTHQDQRLAERIDAAGSPVVVLLNKWELLDAEHRLDVMSQMADRLHFLGEAPVLKISALTGKGVQKLLPALGSSVDRYRTRIPTRKVNQVLQAAQASQPAPHGVRVLYATQGATDPPTFTLFATRTIPPTYLRYLERRLREAFDLGGTPLKLRVRRRSE